MTQGILDIACGWQYAPIRILGRASARDRGIWPAVDDGTNFVVVAATRFPSGRG